MKKRYEEGDVKGKYIEFSCKRCTSVPFRFHIVHSLLNYPEYACWLLGDPETSVTYHYHVGLSPMYDNNTCNHGVSMRIITDKSELDLIKLSS